MCLSLKNMLVHLAVHQSVKVIWSAVLDEREIRLRRYHGARLSMMMWIKLGRKIKKKGGLNRLHTENIKHIFNVTAYPLHDKAVADSKSLILKFLVKQASMLDLKEKGKVLRKRLKFLSKKFKNAHI